MRILLLEADDDLRRRCEAVLQTDGHRVTASAHPRALRSHLRRGTADLLLVGGDSLIGIDDLLRAAGRREDGPAVVVVERGRLERLAEDGSVEGLLRPARATVGGGGAQELTLTACVVDLNAGIVRRGDEEAKLSDLELRLLAYLAERPGRTIPREQLLEGVWGYRSGVVTRTVDITVRRLRVKVEADPTDPVHFITVRGRGYRFDPPRSLRSNLRPDRTSFIGRVEQFGQLERLHADGARLVSILGPAGTGKTRLARRFAARLADRDGADLPGGVWFCDLSGVATSVGQPRPAPRGDFAAAPRPPRGAVPGPASPGRGRRPRAVRCR